MAGFWDLLFGRREVAEMAEVLTPGPSRELRPKKAEKLPLPGQIWLLAGLGPVRINTASRDGDRVSYWYQGPYKADLDSASLREFLQQATLHDKGASLLIAHKERATWFVNCGRAADAGYTDDAEELTMVALLAWDRVSDMDRARMHVLLQKLDGD